MYSGIKYMLPAVLLLGACGSGATTNNSKPKDTAKTVVVDTTHYDRKYNDYARFISGMDMEKGTIMGKFDSAAFFQNFVASLNKRWAEMDKTRLKPMREWAKKEIEPKIDEKMNLFYPFSGPDFLHAFQFFPYSKKYLFLANEMVGVVPEFEKMKAANVSSYLGSMEAALRDIFIRSYFITSFMGKEVPAVKGVIPIFMVFFARTGNEVLNVEYITLNKDGKSIPRPAIYKGINGVRFTFCQQGKRDDLRTLEYFNADISNEGPKGGGGLELHKELVKHIEDFGKANTFIKAASYLLHYGTFTKIKDLTIAKSASILEDDTGIPLKYLAKEFNPYLYGEYTKPVKNFSTSGHYQQDLAKLYSDSTKVGPLPFSLGYHYQDHIQNYMLYVRK